MNTNGILKYGHHTILEELNGLSEAEWLEPGVCGYWSVKDIVAHLASYEWLLVDVLESLLGHEETPRPKFGKIMRQAIKKR